MSHNLIFPEAKQLSDLFRQLVWFKPEPTYRMTKPRSKGKSKGMTDSKRVPIGQTSPGKGFELISTLSLSIALEWHIPTSTRLYGKPQEALAQWLLSLGEWKNNHHYSGLELTCRKDSGGQLSSVLLSGYGQWIALLDPSCLQEIPPIPTDDNQDAP